MVRTVKVNLEADAARYIAPVKESEAATEGLDRKVTGLDRDLNKIPPDAAKAAAAMKALGEESKATAVKLDDVGKRSTSLGALDAQIAKTRTEMRGLADEFNRTGDSHTLQLMFGKADQLKELEKFKKTLSSALDDGAAEGGKAGAKSFVSSFTDSFSGIGSKLMTTAIVAAIVAAFLTASGPILAATGLTGIAAGIVGQVRNPAVQKAFGDMGHDLMTELTAATTSFRQPLINTAQTFGDTLRRVINSIDFSSLSKLIAPLSTGIGGLFTRMMPGFNSALAASVPVIQTLAGELPKLGSALSDMFAAFARSKDGAVVAIHLLVDLLRALAETIGVVVEAGAKVVKWFADVGSAIGGWLSKNGFGALKEGGARMKEFFDNLKDIPSATDAATASVAAFGSHATLTADQLDNLNAALSATKVSQDSLAAAMTAKLFNAMMSVDQATLGVHTSLTALSDSFKQNGKDISEYTKKGQANVAAVQASVTANMQLYQAQVAAGLSATDAAANYDKNTRALHDQLRAAGLTEKQVDSLIGKYKNVPDIVNTDIQAQGLTAAINNLGILIAKVNGLDGKNYGFSVTETHYLVTRDMSTSTRGNRWGGVYEHADVGLLRDAKVFSPAGPARYAFAEPSTGGEAFVPKYGDYGRSTAILDRAARWYGGRFAPGGGGTMYAPTYNVHVHTLDARAAGPVVVAAIKDYERSNGTNWRTAPV